MYPKMVLLKDTTHPAKKDADLFIDTILFIFLIKKVMALRKRA